VLSSPGKTPRLHCRIHLPRFRSKTLVLAQENAAKDFLPGFICRGFDMMPDTLGNVRWHPIAPTDFVSGVETGFALTATPNFLRSIANPVRGFYEQSNHV
jgi:hypothetical protein